MNYSEAKGELKKEFDSFLKPLGYKSKSENQGCVFSLTKGTQYLHITYGVTNYIDEFDTGCVAKISLIPIQIIQGNIFQEIGVYDTLTLSTSMYFNDINYRFKIKTIDDVKAWGTLFRRFYENAVLEFYNKYNSVGAIDILVNTDPTERIIYCDDLYWRMMNGLISAKLNNNPKYDSLREYYESEINSKYQGHFKLDKCKKVIEFLEKNDRERLVALIN